MPAEQLAEFAQSWITTHATAVDSHSREDLVQATVLAFCEQWPRVQHNATSWRAYATGIARRTLASWWRRRNGDINTVRFSDELVFHRSSPARPTAENRTQVTAGHLRAEIQTFVAIWLSPQQRDLFHLHFDAGLTKQEVAALLSVRPCDIQRQLNKICSRAREFLLIPAYAAT